MALYPKPHSPEWFAALEAFNPAQAAHTRQIVKSAGTENVCSMCGDFPAMDFQIVQETSPANAVASIRLCGDCRSMRSSMFGEIYQPLEQA